MPREGKASISVDEETADKLREHKPDKARWDEYLLNRCIIPDAGSKDVTPTADVSTQGRMVESVRASSLDIREEPDTDLSIEWVEEVHNNEFNWPIVRLNYECANGDESMSVELSFNDQAHLAEFGKRLVQNSRMRGHGTSPDE